jgi:predicted nucleic acid-binding protein
VTASDVVLDSWAWWEILHRTAAGRKLRRKYIGKSSTKAHTSVLALGEICARLHQMGRAERVAAVVSAVQTRSMLHDVTFDHVVRGAALRQVLRAGHPDASLADGIMLALTRQFTATLISADRAFDAQPDVSPT